MAFDFVFAAFIFLIAWFYISDKLDFGFAEHENERSVGIMELKANLAADALVKGPGSPRDWENKWKTLGVGSVEMFGLAESDRVFSEAKLSAFSSISSDYPTVKEKLGLDNYDFSFSFTGVDDVNAGLEPMGPTTKLVAVQRAVTYKDQPGLATIKVYVLEG